MPCGTVLNPGTHNIPPEASWFTVLDLAADFFYIPLHEELQLLFAFTWKGQQYTWTRLLQRFTGSLILLL